MTKAPDYLKALLTLREKERERVLVRVPPWSKKNKTQQLVKSTTINIVRITNQNST
mgnify:FL=1